jgi:hypothetical protein
MRSKGTFTASPDTQRGQMGSGFSRFPAVSFSLAFQYLSCIATSSGPLTFDINGEIIIPSSVEQFCTAVLTLFSPSCAFIDPFHRKLPSAHS